MEPKKTDEELVKSFQSGDNSAFNLLLERYKGIIFKIANSSKCEYGYICDLDFDEVVSTLYFTLFNAAKKFDLNGNHFKSYFNVICQALWHFVPSKSFGIDSEVMSFTATLSF